MVCVLGVERQHYTWLFDRFNAILGIDDAVYSGPQCVAAWYLAIPSKMLDVSAYRSLRKRRCASVSVYGRAFWFDVRGNGVVSRPCCWQNACHSTSKWSYSKTYLGW